MPIPVEIIESLATENLKNVAGASSFYSGARMSDHTAHQKRMDQIAEDSARLSVALLGRLAQTIVEEDPMQAVAAQKILTGNDLGQVLSSLGAAIAQIQQLTKGAQTTPPDTSGGK